MKRISITCVVIVVMAFIARGASLSDKDKQFLTGYEKIHVALKKGLGPNFDDDRESVWRKGNGDLRRD